MVIIVTLIEFGPHEKTPHFQNLFIGIITFFSGDRRLEICPMEPVTKTFENRIYFTSINFSSTSYHRHYCQCDISSPSALDSDIVMLRHHCSADQCNYPSLSVNISGHSVQLNDESDTSITNVKINITTNEFTFSLEEADSTYGLVGSLKFWFTVSSKSFFSNIYRLTLFCQWKQ